MTNSNDMLVYVCHIIYSIVLDNQLIGIYLADYYPIFMLKYKNILMDLEKIESDLSFKIQQTPQI